jgi:hypothetical protein
MAKIKLFPFEQFKEITFHSSMKLRYALSDKGRLVSFKNEILDGTIVKGSTVNGYKVFRYKIYENGKTINSHIMYSRLVAQIFLPTPNEDQPYLLYKDYNKSNNTATNLFWGNKAEFVEHGKNSPLFLKARAVAPEKRILPNAKLTVAKVKMIKRLLDSNKNRQVIIAKQFGVSATQIKRIARGENWANV